MKLQIYTKLRSGLNPDFLAVIIFMQDVKMLPYSMLFCYVNILLKITLTAKHYYRHEINSYHILNRNVQVRVLKIYKQFYLFKTEQYQLIVMCSLVNLILTIKFVND